MPCDKCGSLLVMDGDNIVCLKCNGFKVLDKTNTIKVIEENLKVVENTLTDYLKTRVEKNRILEELIWQREKFTRNFFEKYQSLNLPRFLTLSLVVFKIMKEPKFNGKVANNYELEAKGIIDGFEILVRMKEQLLLLREGLAEAIREDGKILIHLCLFWRVTLIRAWREPFLLDKSLVENAIGVNG